MASIVFIHALSKEATQMLLDKEISIYNLQNYIIISDPKITTNDVKHRIEKAVSQNKTILITSPAVQKIKARKHLYDLFGKDNLVRTRIHYEPLHILKERPSLKNVPFNEIYKMYVSAQAPMIGTDCSSVSISSNGLYEDEINYYSRTTALRAHNSPYHAETIPEHIDFVIHNVPGHLKTVARFHDLGKYVARQKAKLSDYDTFINHENVSAMYALVSHCSPRDVRIIQFHMMAHNLTPALVRRYHLEDIEEDLRIFAKADAGAKILPENKWSAKPVVIQKDEPQKYRVSEFLKHGF
mgnify:FL=1|jgi:hypothetical protein